ncbi:MAG: phosphoenolpyruvate--protein phosphotransferase [Planctomycetaceae bacterium]|nr:phosphoenolpyruvate--protein phosphotransferase [Planctomycetaceae bacterium]
MLIKHGIAVSPGIAIAQPMVLGVEDYRIPRQTIDHSSARSPHDATAAEVQRLRAALDKLSDEIAANEALAAEHLGKEAAAIFAAHLLLTRDPKLAQEIEKLIREANHSAEYASSQVLRRYAKSLQNLGNSYLAERAADIFDLERGLLRHLLGEQREDLAHLTAPVVVLAHNLTPSETAGLSREHVKAFVTEVGGATSHTAILAGALEIPALVGVGSFLADASGGELVIVDGNLGQLIIDPDKDTLARYEQIRSLQQSRQQLLRTSGEGIASTNDGVRILVQGNIEFPEEAAHASARGADGIGLYRTEFLYMGGLRERTEEEHYLAYKEVIRAFGDRPVTIRTLDVGSDKIPNSLRPVLQEAPNPELGLRSVRISLEYVDLFKTQLRAILRAATGGDVRLMFPLVSSLPELRQAKMILRDVMEDLDEEGIPFAGDIQIGMMVEVPSAALRADEFAKEVDFFSIGTNDLIQYTLAADRTDPLVAKYYNAADPAVLMLIQNVVRAAENAGIPVTVCGQMSSDPKYLPLLVGMGLRQISVMPQAIPVLKDLIRRISVPEAVEIAERVRTFETARDIDLFLKKELDRLLALERSTPALAETY